MQGSFKRGKLYGHGTITTHDGTVLSGLFFDGWLCTGNINEAGTGDGKMTHPDGEAKEGSFIGGKLVRGRIMHVWGQVIEGEFINETIVKGRITY